MMLDVVGATLTVLCIKKTREEAERVCDEHRLSSEHGVTTVLDASDRSQPPEMYTWLRSCGLVDSDARHLMSQFVESMQGHINDLKKEKQGDLSGVQQRDA